MAFTDEQIKLLETNQYELFGFSKEHIKALLVRLHAAERYCETRAFKERIAWRVSKGELTGKVKLMKASGKEPK